MEKRLETDVLVIGSGIAGATAAITAADLGLSVIVLNRSHDVEESNTRYAQGGIIWEGDDDTPWLLEHDIDLAGDEIGKSQAMEILSNEGPSLVDLFLIKKLKIPFDSDLHGHIHRTSEAAHSRARIIHVGDKTGWAIAEALAREIASHPQITVLTEHTAVDLISTTHHSNKRGAIYETTKILGAYVLEQKSGIVKTILASRTVLATGGIGALWLYNTNPEGARGDGIAMAHRAGAHVINMEYMQFHPTAFVGPNGDRFLISEAVRGEGAILVDADGERFMEHYNPELLELAPRDEVARAIQTHMKLKNTPYVFLDCSPIVRKGIDLKTRFPKIFARCLAAGIDITQSPIPVAPAAHYHCGGIRIDEFGLTNLENLYAVGECSCTGLHGANRLASTSLLEGLVWGVRAAKHISGTLAKENFNEWKIPSWDESDVVNPQPPERFVDSCFTLLKNHMWQGAGIVRSRTGLAQVWRDLSYMQIETRTIYRTTKLSDELIGLRNAVETAVEVVEQALRNKTSRGCHYREDVQ